MTLYDTLSEIEERWKTKTLSEETEADVSAGDPPTQNALAVYGDEPTFKADGYPTEETERTITEWPFENGYHSLLAYVARAWKYPDYFTHDGGSEYKISTGGWSGNEELIGALERNRIFWAFCWVSSTCGGHYVFEVDAPSALNDMTHTSLAIKI